MSSYISKGPKPRIFTHDTNLEKNFKDQNFDKFKFINPSKTNALQQKGFKLILNSSKTIALLMYNGYVLIFNSDHGLNPASLKSAIENKQNVNEFSQVEAYLLENEPVMLIEAIKRTFNQIQGLKVQLKKNSLYLSQYLSTDSASSRLNNKWMQDGIDANLKNSFAKKKVLKAEKKQKELDNINDKNQIKAISDRLKNDAKDLKDKIKKGLLAQIEAYE